MTEIEIKASTIKSPKWANHVVFQNSNGGLPLVSANFTTNGGRLLIFVSGSGWHTGAPQVIGMTVTLDTTVLGNLDIFSNAPNTHRSFIGTTIEVASVSAGTHTITLTAFAGTNTDFNDKYSVTILELPF